MSSAKKKSDSMLDDVKITADLMLDNQMDESRRRGLRVKPMPAEFVRLRHRMAKQQISQQLASLPPGMAQFQIKNTLNHKIFASKSSFSKLQRATIPELQLEVSAKGKYLLARVLEDWFSIAAWNNVIEDHSGHVIGLTMYNYPLDEMFALGDVIIIKEPYLRLPVDQIPIVRVDCPTDIIVLRPAHHLRHLSKGVRWANELAANDPLTAKPIPSTALQWKERGNRFFDRDQLIQAREAYTMGLGVCSESDPTWKIVQLNLLAVQLRLEYWEWVVENAEKLLVKYPNERKAIFRLGKAHYGLRNYGKALEAFEAFCDKFPEEGDGPTELEKARERVRETKGQFDFDKIRAASLKKPTEGIDCADYRGPVKIAKISGKGRGLVATEDVAKGTVLVVSKALAATLDPHKTVGLQIDPGRRMDKDRDRAENVAKVSRLITKNPNTFGPQVYDLHAGEGSSSEQAQVFCDPELKEEVICDVELIKNVSKCNSFAIVEGGRGGQVKTKGGGLFVLPSYINHSCNPNAEAYEFYNDVMVVRAAKELKEGTEVTVTYVPLELSFEERAQLLADRGFKCRCSKCKKRM